MIYSRTDAKTYNYTSTCTSMHVCTCIYMYIITYNNNYYKYYYTENAIHNSSTCTMHFLSLSPFADAPHKSYLHYHHSFAMRTPFCHLNYLNNIHVQCTCLLQSCIVHVPVTVYQCSPQDFLKGYWGLIFLVTSFVITS